jgi:WD40 repeat protein
LLDQNGGPVRSLALSPDGLKVLAGGEDHEARVWDATSGAQRLTLKGHEGAVTAVGFSQDGSRILTGGDDKTARMWDAAVGTQLLVVPTPGWVSSVDLSPDGLSLAVGSDGQAVTLFQAASGAVLHEFQAHPAWKSPLQWRLPLSVAFVQNGRRLVTAGLDQNGRIWEPDRTNRVATLIGHSGAVLCLSVSPDGRRIVTGAADHTAKIWPADYQEPLRLLGHTDMGPAVTYSRDGRTLVTGSFDSTVRVWELATATSRLELRGHAPHYVWGVAMSPDGRRIVSSGDDLTAKVWDARSGALLLTFTNHTTPIWAAALSSDGQRMVTGDASGQVLVWEALTGKVLVSFKGHMARITSASFSPDGTRILTSAEDNRACVWDSSSGQLSTAFTGHRDRIRAAAFSPDGRRAATASFDRTAVVWDAATGNRQLILRGHRNELVNVAFSPDGRRILTGGFDKQTKLWDAETGDELLTLDDCIGITFSPDGQSIACALDPGTTIWRAADSKQVAQWQEAERQAEETIRARQQELTEARRLRAQDPGTVRRWLTLLPLSYAGGSGSAALSNQPLSNEGELTPQAGERVTLEGLAREWRPIELEGELIDFAALAGVPGISYVLAYAVCYVRSEEPREVLLLVRSDDQCRVYLNGAIVHEWSRPRSVSETEYASRVQLRAGMNRVVFKVLNEEFGWQGSVRFATLSGGPVPGLSVTLDPPPPP